MGKFVTSPEATGRRACSGVALGDFSLNSYDNHRRTFPPVEDAGHMGGRKENPVVEERQEHFHGRGGADAASLAHRRGELC